MVFSRMVGVFLGILFSAMAFGASTQDPVRTTSVFSSPYDGRFISVMVSSYASHRRLCGSNAQLGADTFEYSSECCEERDDKCVSEKSCRRPVANCVYVREDGSKEIYKSRGAKECGQCVSIDPGEPAEVVTPF